MGQNAFPNVALEDIGNNYKENIMQTKRIIIDGNEIEVRVYPMHAPDVELNVKSTTKGKWKDRSGLHAYRRKERKSDRRKLLNRGYVITNNRQASGL